LSPFQRKISPGQITRGSPNSGRYHLDGGWGSVSEDLPKCSPELTGSEESTLREHALTWWTLRAQILLPNRIMDRFYGELLERDPDLAFSVEHEDGRRPVLLRKHSNLGMIEQVGEHLRCFEPRGDAD